MAAEHIQYEINQLLVDCLGCDIADITPEKHLVADLLADSVALLDIAMAVENKFNFIFDEKMMEKMNTVADLYAIIRRSQTVGGE
ncbi:acyl carrier protein [[Erwinia] mediterraneensis]|uniref:acyl carrier protein n=1 Tax=[Erwinia] mediterraneensis TaxID=2161819 RepID=UPI0010326D51|nr:acyl carrier protein [[Erwinia] mediterraneensis]